MSKIGHLATWSMNAARIEFASRSQSPGPRWSESSKVEPHSCHVKVAVALRTGTAAFPQTCDTTSANA